MVLNTREIIRAVVNSEKKLNISGLETGSNFTFSFNKDVIRITEIIIESIQIPYSFYAIDARNNVLTFNKGNISITIPPGNYTTSTLTLQLTSLINAAFGDSTTTVTFSYSTLKLTITRGIAFNVDAAIDFPASTASKPLGFNISTITSTTVTGNNTINISGPNYLLLTSNFLTHPVYNHMLYIDSSYQNVLATIPVVSASGDIISLSDKVSIPIKLSYKFNILADTPMDFKVTDEFGNVMNLNGTDVAVHLIFITE